MNFKRSFSINDQLTFARLSGDFNLIHLDYVHSRRTMIGEPIVHGINLLLWALDCWLNINKNVVKINGLEVQFNKFVGIEEQVEFVLEPATDNQVVIKIEHLGDVKLKIRLSFNICNKHKSFGFGSGHLLDNVSSARVGRNEIISANGNVPLSFNATAFSKIYPSLLPCIGESFIAILLATSRVVGMRCPGQNSLYCELQINKKDKLKLKSLEFQVRSFDDRFQLATIDLFSPGYEGILKAFLLSETCRQESYSEISMHVQKEIFKGQRALVVGGSRGLGEVTAKLLAAGGAEVKLTYNSGSSDADAVTNEICDGGGVASSMHFDVLEPTPLCKASIESTNENWKPTHLYYFATPHITVSNSKKLSQELINKYTNFYLTGFIATLERFRGPDLSFVFYPSTTYVEKTPKGLSEYASIKSAGEKLCVSLDKKESKVTYYFARLPRLATDQTTSHLSLSAPSATKYMLDQLLSATCQTTGS
jgi:hypothetical protein